MHVQDHYLAWRQSHNNDHRSPAGMGPFSFCSFPFLLNAKAKTRLLQVEAKMQMEQTVAEARLEQVRCQHEIHIIDNLIAEHGTVMQVCKLTLTLSAADRHHADAHRHRSSCFACFLCRLQCTHARFVSTHERTADAGGSMQSAKHEDLCVAHIRLSRCGLTLTSSSHSWAQRV